jgi:hypothetical protein
MSPTKKMVGDISVHAVNLVLHRKDLDDTLVRNEDEDEEEKEEEDEEEEDEEEDGEEEEETVDRIVSLTTLSEKGEVGTVEVET